MQKFWITVTFALMLTGGLIAMGVSPKQSTASNQTSKNIEPHPQPGNSLQAIPQESIAQVTPNLQATLAAYSPAAFAKNWTHLNFDTAIAWHSEKGTIFLDARSKQEYDRGHIPGALPMPVGQFNDYFAKYEKQLRTAKKLVTYCHGVGCKLSDKVAKLVKDKKVDAEVGIFFGGWPQWQQNNLPIEKGESTLAK